jgi:hypothetical protein
MDQQNPPTNTGAVESTTQVDTLNGLFQELESGLTDQQHALLTRLFSERAVLTAMRAHLAGTKSRTAEL